MGPPVSNAHKTYVLLVSLAFVLVVPLAVSTPAAAATVNITLFGSRAGWGTNNTTLTSPGPDLMATLGDTVVLTVNATDQFSHAWYLDYNNDTVWNETTSPWEPGTTFPNATTGSAVTISFVVNQTGTFQYRSVGNPDRLMVGNFIVASGGGLIPGVDNTILIIVGIVVIVIAVLAIVAMFGRRKKTLPPPPPRE